MDKKVIGIRPIDWVMVNMRVSMSMQREEESRYERHAASTEFYTFSIELENGKWRWSYYFTEHTDEDRNLPCDSLEDGKAKCWKLWLDRIEYILDYEGEVWA